MPQHPEWPNGLTDEEAIQRLQSLVIGACDGVRDLVNDRDYTRLRRPLLGRPDLRDVVPSFIRSQRDLTSLWNYLRGIGRERELRRQHVWTAFGPLFDRIHGRTRPPVAAASWTGKRTVGQQAQIVLSIGPTAFEAVDMLLDEQERPLHNLGPVDPERLKGIAQLKELHAALGELIVLAQSGHPLTDQLQRVRALKDRALHWSTETYELMLAQTPLIASSAVFGSALWFLTNLITKDLDASATMAGSIVAGGALAAARKSRNMKR